MRTSNNRVKLAAGRQVMRAPRESVTANRALVLYERTGEEWHFARSHSWYAPGHETDMRTASGRGELPSLSPSVERQRR